MNARTIPAVVAALLMMAVPALAAVELLTAPDPGVGDHFGQSVAVDGSVHLDGPFVGPVVVVGAPYDDDGAAWVRYPRADGTPAWQKLTSPRSRKYGSFGWSVGVSGDRVVVGGTLRVMVFRHEDGSFVFEAEPWPKPGATLSQDYGKAVAIDGDTVVVGDGNQGMVYVYVHGDTGWVEQQRFDSGADRAHRFGTSVDVDGDRLIVGTGASAAYVFVKNGDTWTREGVLTGTGVTGTDDFGTVVSISGDVAVVGAPNDEHVAKYAGSAYVFRFENGAWTEKQHLVAKDAKYGSRFGNDVAVDGPLILVGAHRDELPTAWYGGAVYEFALAGGVWKERRKVTSPTASGGDEFGNAVALSGNVAVGGAYLDNAITPEGDILDSGTACVWPVDKVLDPAATDFGRSVSVACDTAIVGAPTVRKALVYRRHGAAWRETATLSVDEPDFGHAVAVDGDRAVVGSRGTIHVFRRIGEAWTKEQELTDADADFLGLSVALSVDTIAVGGDSISLGRRVVRLYRLIDGTWRREQRIPAPDGVMSANFGFGVALREDTLIVGDPTADHQGQNTGAAYVYARTAAGWTLTETLLSPDGKTSQVFGLSISIGEDRILVGAAGHASLFEKSGGAWTLETKLLPADAGTAATFGHFTALSGDTAVVSRTDGSHIATVFVREADAWHARRELEAVDGTWAGGSSHPVAICGNSLLVADSIHDVVLAFHGVGAEIPALDLDGPDIPVSTTGVSYSGRYVRTGGLRPPYIFSMKGDFPITGGVDPATGLADGVYAAPGDYSFTVRVTDGCGVVAERTFACTVNEAPRIVTTALPSAAAGRPYDATLDAIGGTGKLRFLPRAGSLPAGLTFDMATGRISGTPTVDGAFPASFVVEDSVGVESDPAFLDLTAMPVANLSLRKLREDVDLSAGRRIQALELVRGTLLTVKVKFPKGAPDAATLRLFDPRGGTADLGESLKVKAKGIMLKKFEIPSCGRWFLVLEPAKGAAGAARMDVKVKAPKKAKGTFTLDPGASTMLTVGALPGATARIQVKAGAWSAALPEIRAVTDEAGQDLLALGELKVRGKVVTLTLSDTRAAGRLTITFGNTAGLVGELTVKVAVKEPKAYGYAMPEEPCGLMR